MMRKRNQRLSRGIRNNNPFNIRKSGESWLGKLPNSTDSDFEQFVNIRFGIRAGLVLLRTYIRKYNLCSVSSIINRFAPESENNTSAYVSFVSARLFNLGYTDGNIDFATPQFIELVCAMLIFESGYDAGFDMIQDLITHFNLA